MPRFSIGYNFDFKGFVSILRNNDHIESVYFPIPRKCMGSGRILEEEPDYEMTMMDLAKDCASHGIKPLVLLNGTIVATDQIKSSLDYLMDIYLREPALGVVVTDPYLLSLIRKNLPGIFIEASTLCRIRTVQEARYFKEIGADRMTADRETIRDLKLLKKISQVLPVKVLANEGCLKDCIHRYSHYGFLSTNTEKQPLFTFTRSSSDKKEHLDRMDSMCVSTITMHPHKVFSSPFIRPEDLHNYSKITDIFKLSTRNFDTARIEKTLHSYISQKHDGNLIDILNSVYTDRLFSHIDNNALNGIGFFEKLSKCNDDCEKCRFCHGLLKHAWLK